MSDCETSLIPMRPLLDDRERGEAKADDEQQEELDKEE
jgi:hypothetical protein